MVLVAVAGGFDGLLRAHWWADILVMCTAIVLGDFDSLGS